MEFKIGDKVRIKPWEQVEDHWSILKNSWDKFTSIYIIEHVSSASVTLTESAFSFPKEALIKVEESTTTSTCKYKVGDVVQIKSLDWYNTNKNSSGDIPYPCNYSQNFIANMSQYCGKQYKIRSIDIGYRLEDLSGKNIDWNWQDWMVEDSIVGDKKIIEDPYPIGSTFTSNGNTYMVVEKSEGGCTECDFSNTTMKCSSDRPKDFYCIGYHRSDNKFVLVKKIISDNSKNLEVTDKYPIGSILEHEGREYIVTLDPKNGDVCEDCDAEDSEGNCPSVESSEFRCCALNRLDNTKVILKLKSEPSPIAIPVDNKTVIIRGIPCKIISGSLCKDCAFYSNCIGSKCKCGAGETYQRVDSFPTTLGMYGNLNSISTRVGLIEQIEVPNGMDSPKESLIIKGLDKETLLQIEEIPNTTVNKEIQLESVIIEYGIL